MRTRNLLLLVAVAALGSCTSAYKSGQTPDDVYYSPGKAGVGVASTQNSQKQGNYEDEYVDVNDRYLRMKAYNYDRWSAFDNDYMYWNDYRWNNSLYFNYYSSPYYSPYIGSIGWYTGLYYQPWNNPFCPIYYGQPIVVVSPKPIYRNPIANGPRIYNLNTYTRPSGTYDSKFGKFGNNRSNNGSYVPIRSFNNRSSGSDNSSGRKVYTPSQSEQRSYSPSRSSGNSGSSGGSRGSGGGSSPTRSFPRGGG